MKFLKHLYISKRISLYTFISYLYLFLLLSCSEGSITSDISQENESSYVSVRIPYNSGNLTFGNLASNSQKFLWSQDEKEEGKINTLWFCAYPVNKDEGYSTVMQLDISELLSSENDYYEFKVPLVTGLYNIYLLVNLDDYLNPDEINDNITEEELKKIVLRFSAERLPVYGNLPMACLAEEIMTAENRAKAVNGVLVSDETTIIAPLTFLCTKIRFTILFDKEDFSKDFTSTQIDFDNKVIVDNIMYKTPLIRGGNVDNTLFSINDLRLNKVDYPAVETEGYLSTADNRDSKNLSDLTIIDTFDDSKMQRAWQVIFYLPENPLTENESKTTFTFTPISGNDELKEKYIVELFSQELESEDLFLKRGNFYDIVARFTSPNSDLDTGWKEGVASGIYLKMYYDYSKGTLRNQSQFYTTSQENMWKTEGGQYIYQDDSFIVFDNNTNITYGKDGNKEMSISDGLKYNLAISNVSVRYPFANYTGRVTLVKNSDNLFTIYFEDINN